MEETILYDKEHMVHPCQQENKHLSEGDARVCVCVFTANIHLSTNTSFTYRCLVLFYDQIAICFVISSGWFLYQSLPRPPPKITHQCMNGNERVTSKVILQDITKPLIP